MTYRLFLDDIRDPHWVYPRDAEDWVIARTHDDAVAIFYERGFPEFVSFDHDLADEHYAERPDGQEHEKTGLTFAKFLVNNDLDHGTMPGNFGFLVHSANPVGAANIMKYLNSYLLSIGRPNHWMHT
jgi:hypothetical protein